ncbi:helix-turn-helix domain-containing protein [Nocardia concava]|uniref:helix-turn-helix domain-containing protein n=1 Tax=Nocardia concava TaxID=257281 RepID=UPI000315B80E|nr:helix-turn-helix domain-containing protein [Nocardia concava]
MQRLDGVALSDDDAAELVAALDALARLAADRGARLSPRLVALRHGLAQGASSSREHPHADARTGVDFVLDALTVDTGAVDTATAARALGLTPDGVRYLCRSKRLPGFRSGGRWWINAAELDALVQARRTAAGRT